MNFLSYFGNLKYDKNMTREFKNKKNMIKKYDKIFSVFQNMIKINKVKNIKFSTNMIKKNMIEKYDIKYDKVF